MIGMQRVVGWRQGVMVHHSMVVSGVIVVLVVVVGLVIVKVVVVGLVIVVMVVIGMVMVVGVGMVVGPIITTG